MTGLSSKRLAGLFAGLDDAVIVADPDRRIVYANPAVERVFGYQAEELVGGPTHRIYAEESDYRRLGHEMFSREPAREGQRHRVYYRRKNGETFASETVASTLRGADGTLLGFLGIVHDITDRLAVEKEAAAAAATLQDAVEAIDEGFALFDPEDRLALCNERYRAAYPLAASAIVPGATFEEILRSRLDAGEYRIGRQPPEKWLEERLRAHRRADGTRIEEHLGDGRWMQIRERRTRRGGIAGIRADITALKEAQRQVVEVSRDRETLTNNMPCLIEELDRDGRCVFINAVGAHWLGTTGAAALRQRTGRLFSPEDQEKIRPLREAALAGRPTEGEAQLRFPDGQRRDVVLHYIPKADAAGGTAGTFVFIADVSEQKKVERTLQRLHRIVSSGETRRGRNLGPIIEAGCDHFDLPIGMLGRVDGDAYTVVHACVPGKRPPDAGRYRLEQTYCAEMLQRQGALAVENVALSPLSERECYRLLGYECYIGARVEVNGVLFGALFFASPEPRAQSFTGGDRAIVKQLADWIGNEIARDRDLDALRRANSELERLASTDDLTGLLNRREFSRRADIELARARRYDEPVSVLVLDIDRFKEINDRHGHAAGDEVLRGLARTIGGMLRPTDIFGRLGGEEFAAVLGHTDEEGALMVAERLRAAARRYYDLGEDRGEAEVTVSLGVAGVQPSDTSIAGALERADTAMYAAKAAGRNRARGATAEPAAPPPARA